MKQTGGFLILLASCVFCCTGNAVAGTVPIKSRHSLIAEQLCLAETAVKTRDTAAGLAALNAADASGPDRRESWQIAMLYGKLYLDAGRLEQAIEAYQQAVQRYPGREESRIALAKAYERSELYALAEQEFHAVVRKNRRSFAAHDGLGRLYLRQGLNGPALEYFKRALTIRPDAEVYRQLSYCAENTGDLPLALAMLRQATSLSRTYEDLVRLGRMYQVQKRFGDAETSFSDAIRLEPDQIEAYLLIALLYLETGDVTAAENLLLIAQEKQPAQGSTHFFLSLIRYQQRQYAAAAAEIAAARQAFGDHRVNRYAERFAAYLAAVTTGK
jgi:tetratricopeptide (TPR) repeat protein